MEKIRGNSFLKSFLYVIGLVFAIQSIFILWFAIYPKAFYYRAWEFFVELADKTISIESCWEGAEYGDLSRDNFFLYQQGIKTEVSTDKDGFRSVPLQSDAFPIVVAGASDVFGAHLSDHETLPWLIAENTKIPTFNAGNSDIFRTLSRPELSSVKLLIDVVPERYLSVIDARKRCLLEYRPIACNTHNYFEGLLEVAPNRYLLPFILDRNLKRILKDIHDYHTGKYKEKYLFIRHRHEKKDIYTAAKSILERKLVFNRLGYNYLFAAIPAKQTVYADDVDETTRYFTPRLTKTLSALGVDSVDLGTPFFLNGNDELHYRYDTHWTANGVKLTAEIISQKILGNKHRLLDMNSNTHFPQSKKPEFCGDGSLFVPPWKSPAVCGESLMFIQRNTTDEISVSLLFRAGKIKRLINAAQNIEYIEGKDFRLSDDGKTILLLPESRIPVVKHDELYKAEQIVVDENISIFQVYVTYAPKDKDYWTGYSPKHTHGALPHTRERLNNKNPITLGIIGDSIAAGWNSSKHMGFPPYQPSFVELFADKIKNHYKADVHLFNYAAAGATTLRADEDSKRIAEINPDLVIIAYGINDALFSTSVRDYVGNIQNAVNTIKRKNPHCEFIIVCSSLGNPEILHEANKLMLAYSHALQGLWDDSVVISDMSRLWEYLLAGKEYMGITGNGCNHPNDFGHVLYAQSLFELISSSHAPAL